MTENQRIILFYILGSLSFFIFALGLNDFNFNDLKHDLTTVVIMGLSPIGAAMGLIIGVAAAMIAGICTPGLLVVGIYRAFKYLIFYKNDHNIYHFICRLIGEKKYE